MKKLLFFTVLCLIANRFLSAQDYSHEYGKWTPHEFKMTKYEKDTSAEAVVIYDIGESYFQPDDEGLNVIFQRRTKIKILSKAGLRWAQNEILLYIGDSKIEEVYDLYATTYNYENNQVRKTSLESKNIFEEKINQHLISKKFAMPDVKVGSIIEFQYSIKSPFVFEFRGWGFQQKIPVIYSEYTAKMVPFYEYSFILQGANKFDEQKSEIEAGTTRAFGVEYRNMIYNFIMKDIPAFKDEEFITSPNDYMIKINFQLSAIHRPNGSNEQYITTWPKMVKDLLEDENFGKYQKSSMKIAPDIIKTMNLDTFSTLNKIKQIEKYVKSNFNWNGFSNFMATQTVKNFIKTKKGNSAEINLFLAGMLNAAGIQACPVILSTREHGKIKADYPFYNFFNYTIVFVNVDNKNILLDATEPLCSFDIIPSRCINDKGLIIMKDNPQWAFFNDTKESGIFHQFDLSFNSSLDTLSADVQIKTTAYDALEYRSDYLTDKNGFKKMLSKSDLVILDSIRTQNFEDVENPFSVNFKARAEFETLEDKLIISPFCGKAISENPFKQESRTYPIDMIYKTHRYYSATIHIPKGYKIFSKPKDLLTNNSFLTIQYNVQPSNDNTIIITAFYKFKKEVYDGSDYNYLKACYKDIVDKFNEKIILVKQPEKPGGL